MAKKIPKKSSKILKMTQTSSGGVLRLLGIRGGYLYGFCRSILIKYFPCLRRILKNKMYDVKITIEVL